MAYVVNAHILLVSMTPPSLSLSLSLSFCLFLSLYLSFFLSLSVTVVDYQVVDILLVSMKLPHPSLSPSPPLSLSLSPSHIHCRNHAGYVVLFSILCVSSLCAGMKDARVAGTTHIRTLWLFDKL